MTDFQTACIAYSDFFRGMIGTAQNILIFITRNLPRNGPSMEASQ
jgi:hypothetical protein